jgi:hypothetical protein
LGKNDIPFMTNKPICSRTLIGHGDNAARIVLRSTLHVMFISKWRTPMRLTTGTCACWVAGLDLAGTWALLMGKYVDMKLTINPGTSR